MTGKRGSGGGRAGTAGLGARHAGNGRGGSGNRRDNAAGGADGKRHNDAGAADDDRRAAGDADGKRDDDAGATDDDRRAAGDDDGKRRDDAGAADDDRRAAGDADGKRHNDAGATADDRRTAGDDAGAADDDRRANPSPAAPTPADATDDDRRRTDSPPAGATPVDALVAPSSSSDERLLQLLRGADFVSGEHIADLLGVSRAAVGKRVTELRKRGFAIAATPRRGYRLDGEPDALDAAVVQPRLATDWLGRAWRHLPTTGSTNDEAAAWARAGAPAGAVVVADAQTRGRGRLGRRWHSPSGASLYFSVVLRPPLPPHRVPPLTLAAGVAVAEALTALDITPQLKWPNDVLLDGKKVAGILTEMSSDSIVSITSSSASASTSTRATSPTSWSRSPRRRRWCAASPSCAPTSPPRCAAAWNIGLTASSPKGRPSSQSPGSSTPAFSVAAFA